MKEPSKTLRSILLACMAGAALCLFSAIEANAATITSAQTGNWSATTTWVGGVVPVAGDNAVIAAGHTVTLTANSTITGLTVNATGTLSTATFTFGVSGNLVVNGTLSGTGAITLSGAATNIDGTGSITNTAQLTISAAHTILATANLSFSGTIRVLGAIVVTNNGTVTTAAAGGITGSVAGATWTQGTTGVLNIAGPLLATGTLDASANGNTLNYNGAAQTVKASATYHHLLLGGSGGKTLTATTTTINGNLTLSGTATATTVVGLTINGNLTVGTGTTFTAAAFALSANGTTSITGTLRITSATGAKAFGGDVTVNTGGTWNNSGNAAVAISANISNAGTFTAGTGVYTLSGSNKTIGGTFSIPSVTVSGTYQNDGSLTVTTALAGAGTLANGAAGTLNINFTGAVGLSNLTATAIGNTISYGFAGAQTIKSTTYHHLSLSNSGAKTAGGALTVNGDFTLSGTATFAGGTSLTHTFLGNWIVNTTAVTPFSFVTTSTLNFNTPGTPAATSISGSTAATLAFNSVNLNNTSGFSSAENFSASGTITIAANVTFTPATAVVVSGTGTLTGNGTAKVTRTAATPDFNSQYSISNKTLTNLTVDYDATAAQTVNALNYFNLTISANRGGATVTLAAGAVGVSGTFAPNATNVSYTITGNTINYNGAIAQNVIAFNYNNLTSSSTGARTLAGSGTIGVAGTFTPGANTYTITGSTIDFNGSGAQTIPAFNYHHLTSSSTGARTLANSGTIGIAGTFTPGSNSYTMTGSTIDFNGSGAQTIPIFDYNHLTSSSTGTRTLANSGTIGIAGAFTPGSNSYTVAGSTIDFKGSTAQTIAAFDYNNLTISAARSVNNVTLAGSGSIGVAGTLTDTATFNAGNGFVTAGSTVNYNGTGSQSVTGLSPLVAGNSSYNNLTISNTAAAVTAGTNFSAAGNFTVNANAVFAPTSAVVISGPGTLTGNGTVQVTRATGLADFAGQYTISNKTLTNLTVEFAGTSTQGAGADVFGGLKISNSSGVTLSGSVTVNAILTLAGGNITTGANKVIVSSAGSVSRTSGYIAGILQRNVGTGPTSMTFEIGDATNYTPVDVSFTSVSVAGDLTVSTTPSDHPNIATSTINPAKTVNRYWTLTNSGITFTNYSATFTFVAGDLDSGVNTNALVVGKFSPSTWSYPAVGTRTANSTQATGITSFSDFQLGELGPPNLDLVKAVSPLGDQEPGTELNYTVTFTNSGATSAQTVIIMDPNPSHADPLQRVFANVDYKLGSASISAPWAATIEFSSDGGTTWSYVPSSGAGGAPTGFDGLVSNIRWSITGVVAAGSSGTVSFITRIR